MIKLPKIPLFRKDLEKKKLEDFQRRSKLFYEEYRELVKKYGCDWSATIEASPNGIVPKINIIDCKDRVETEKKLEIKKEDDQNKN